jgi:hypothetical protein
VYMCLFACVFFLSSFFLSDLSSRDNKFTDKLFFE